MTDLLHFINRISPRGLHRAPFTIKSTWVSGESPYKVILLLSVMLAMHRDKVARTGLVHYLDCARVFKEVYSIVFPNADSDWEPKIVQPYWYFGSGRPRLWRLIPQEGQAHALIQAISAKKQVTNEKTLCTLVECGELDGGDCDLLQDPLAAKVIFAYLAAEYLSKSPGYQQLLTLTKYFK